MLKPLDKWELAQCQVMTNQYAKSLKTRKPKTDDEADKQAGLTFSGQATFSDTGNDKADFNFDDFNKKAKAETALFTIKRLVARHSVKDSVKKFILQRQSTIAANKKKKEEAEKLRQNGWQST
jgi:hypothetical protein